MSDTSTKGPLAMSTELVERERQWCLSCGTITRNGRCDCSDDRPEAQRLVNYAHEVSSEAKKLWEANAALTAEVERCHARLEIDHYWRMSDNDDSDLERVEIPMEERETSLDGIEARDATIALIEEDNAALTAKVALLTEALATDRLAVIEECAKEIDQLAALLSQQFEALDISREVSAYGIAANAIRALSEPEKNET